MSFDSAPLPGGSALIDLSRSADSRGSLTAVTFDSGMPFVPRRFFAVTDVSIGEVRGEHAHRTCHQLLIALAGALTVLLDDGLTQCEVRLGDPGRGLHIPPMVWAAQFNHEPGTVLGVLASEPYDPLEYVTDRQEFLRLARSSPGHRR